VLVIVEGTEASVVLPRMTQLDPGLGDEVNDIYFGFDFINGGHSVNEL